MTENSSMQDMTPNAEIFFKTKRRSTLIAIIGTPWILGKTDKNTEREERLRWGIGREEVAISAVLADIRKGGVEMFKSSVVFCTIILPWTKQNDGHADESFSFFHHRFRSQTIFCMK